MNERDFKAKKINHENMISQISKGVQKLKNLPDEQFKICKKLNNTFRNL
jgi:hypothetical protein